VGGLWLSARSKWGPAAHPSRQKKRMEAENNREGGCRHHWEEDVTHEDGCRRREVSGGVEDEVEM